MRGAISDVIDARTPEDNRLPRRVAYSLGVHLAVAAIFVFVPSSWLSGETVKPNVIEVSLAGSSGAPTTGTAPISARRVEEAVPETRRPEPVKPAPPPKPDTMPTPEKAVTPPKTPEKPPETKPTPAAATPTPATGRQVQAGNAVVETGASGTSQGLTQAGGAGTGGVVDLNTFDPAWVAQMRDAIAKVWDNLQPETGWAEVLFVVRKDGTLVSRDIVASSGSVNLGMVALRAVGMALLPPLPRDYSEPTLRVRLRFNYEVK